MTDPDRRAPDPEALARGAARAPAFASLHERRRPAAAPRPAWALAVLAAVAALALLIVPRLARHDAAPARATARVPLAPGEPRYGADGSVRLDWSEVAGATGYEIRLYTTALEDLGRHPAGGASSATLGPGELPPAYRSGEVILYRIIAFRGRDPIAHSPTRTLSRP